MILVGKLGLVLVKISESSGHESIAKVLAIAPDLIVVPYHAVRRRRLVFSLCGFVNVP